MAMNESGTYGECIRGIRNQKTGLIFEASQSELAIRGIGPHLSKNATRLSNSTITDNNTWVNGKRTREMAKERQNWVKPGESVGRLAFNGLHFVNRP